ncbi:MAG: 30S ribosomal protein S16 [Gammaproteobacteria bacterium]|nr:30S ribosomal protein S16 [Gammaproteobacteria bacterium]
MVVIRLARSGSKKNPFYHVVVADKRSPRDGRFIENVGYFNPMARGQEARLKLQQERIAHWIGQGAQASERVNHLVQEFKKLEGQAPKPAPTKAELKRAQAEKAEKAAAIKAKQEAEKAKAEADAAAKEEAEKAKAEQAEKAKAEADQPAEDTKATDETQKPAEADASSDSKDD